MFAIGLMLHGRIFPFEFSEPLVALAAIADVGLGGPWLLARMAGAGSGLVTASTYEYGNTFLIVAGLLNFLVVLDAFDIAMGRNAQVTSHFLLLVLFAFLVSIVFAVLMRDDPRQQIRTAGVMFATFVATAVILGWLMYPLPL